MRYLTTYKLFEYSDFYLNQFPDMMDTLRDILLDLDDEGVGTMVSEVSEPPT